MHEYDSGWINLALKSKDLRKKVEYCIKHLERHPNHSDAWDYLAEVMDRLEDPLGAVSCYEKAAFDKDPEYLVGIIRLDEDEDSLKSAIELFKKIEDKEPRAFIDKGRAFLALKKPSDALISLSRALSANLGKLCDRKAHFWKSSALMDLGKYEDAIDSLNAVLAIDPGDFKALFTKGYLLQKVGRFQESIDYLKEYKSLDLKHGNDGAADDGIRRAEEQLKEQSRQRMLKK